MLYTAAADLGLSEPTLRRARLALGVIVLRTGFGAGAQWHWALPGTGSRGRAAGAEEQAAGDRQQGAGSEEHADAE